MNKLLAMELRRCIRSAQASLQQTNNLTTNCKVRYVTLSPMDAYDERFMSMKHYANVMGLYWFLKKQNKINNEQLKQIVSTELKEFEFLNRFINYFPHIIEDLNECGPYEMATTYVKAQMQNVVIAH